MASAPLPPLDLMDRVGSVRQWADPGAAFDQLGARAVASIRAALPDDWRWEGKRVLDFGCGAGRTLRHLLTEAAVAELWGCDIDAPSVEWVRHALCPPLAGVVLNGPTPPVDLPAGHFDLIYAVSVFTHLSIGWEEWLLEMHRLLADGGLLVATFIGEGAASWIVDEPWDAETIGMSVSRHGQSWDDGGPMVLHSPWWLEAHWGRIFDIVELIPSGFGQPEPSNGHGIVVARKDRPAIRAAALAEPAPDDPREVRWLHREVERRVREVGALYARLAEPPSLAEPPALAELPAMRAEVEALRVELAATRGALADRQQRVADLEASTSWRITAPLRRLRARPEPTPTPTPTPTTTPVTGVFHPIGDTSSPTRSTFGGLWFDRADAAELLTAAEADGRVTAEEAAALRSLGERGFAIVPGAIEPEVVARLAADIDAVVEAHDERFLVTVNGYRGAAPTAIEPWMADKSTVKLLDAYCHLASAQAVLLHPSITRFLRLAFNGEDPVLFQSLSFLCGSEQWLHQDSAYVRVDRPMELVACWIALEDVQPGAGELLYAPGSHLLPEQLFGGEHKSWLPDRDGRDVHERWAHALPGRVAEAGCTVERFLPKAGDILFWHADLVHGGNAIEDPAKRRRSIVGHYCPASAEPRYANRNVAVRSITSGAAFSSDHYG